MFVDEFDNPIPKKIHGDLSFADKTVIDWFTNRPAIRVRQADRLIGSIFTDDWTFQPSFLAKITFNTDLHIRSFIEIEKEKLCGVKLK